MGSESSLSFEQVFQVLNWVPIIEKQKIRQMLALSLNELTEKPVSTNDEIVLRNLLEISGSLKYWKENKVPEAMDALVMKYSQLELDIPSRLVREISQAATKRLLDDQKPSSKFFRDARLQQDHIAVANLVVADISLKRSAEIVAGLTASKSHARKASSIEKTYADKMRRPANGTQITTEQYLRVFHKFHQHSERYLMACREIAQNFGPVDESLIGFRR